MSTQTLSLEEAARGRIVVGVDGSDPGAAALGWAADVADRLGLGLCLLSVQEILSGTPHELGWSAGVQELVAAASEELLEEARGRVLESHAGLEVVTVSQWGSPAAALVEVSAHAQWIVVGSRGASGWGALLLGSVSNAVAAHARCPVVVVRRNADGVVTPLGGPVVLGVDDSAEARAAADLAFRCAQAFGVPLRAVHSWTLAFHGGVVPTDPGSEASQVLEAEHERILADGLDAPTARYPDVTVERVIRQGAPARVLAEESADASLVVVGSRGRGGFRGLLLGSTSRNLLTQAHAPVAVVHAHED